MRGGRGERERERVGEIITEKAEDRGRDKVVQEAIEGLLKAGRKVRAEALAASVSQEPERPLMHY